MRKHTLVAGLVAGAILIAACGSDDDDPVASDAAGTSSPPGAAVTTAPASSAAPATSVAAGSTGAPAAPSTAAETSASSETTEAAEGPQAIVSLAPTHTETLFAIGAGDQVIAVDDQSDFPAEAVEKVTDLSGFEPNVEAIAGYEPDLVVMSDATIQPQLEGLGIAVWVGPAPTTFDEAFTQIEQLGAATGHVGEAAELVGQLSVDIDAAVASVPAPAVPLSIYHELDNTFFSANSATFIGQAYAAFGLQNIADQAEGDSAGYPQLNAEAIIGADPDLIFLADGSFGESPETVAARPGWQDIAAVANGNVFVVDEDVASRWGPRIAEYVQFVADSLAQVAVGADG